MPLVLGVLHTILPCKIKVYYGELSQITTIAKIINSEYNHFKKHTGRLQKLKERLISNYMLQQTKQKYV